MYKSHLTVQTSKNNSKLYLMRWKFAGGDTSTASGFMQSNVLVAVFHAKRQAPSVKKPDHNGVISYIVRPNKLVKGKWHYDDSYVIGTEHCTKITKK